MPDRTAVTRLLLVIYFLGSVAAAVAQILAVGRAGSLADTTSGKILAAALLALGGGALAATRDPWRQRLLIQVIIAFTALSSLAILYRLLIEQRENDPAWLVLPFALAAPVLLAVFFPRPPQDEGVAGADPGHRDESTVARPDPVGRPDAGGPDA